MSPALQADSLPLSRWGTISVIDVGGCCSHGQLKTGEGIRRRKWERTEQRSKKIGEIKRVEGKVQRGGEKQEIKRRKEGKERKN